MIKKVTAFALALALCGNIAYAAKDETVYAFLSTDGSLQKLSVVNAIKSESGSASDFGEYSSIRSMVGDNPASISGDSITFTNIAQDTFYYEGISEKAFPWLAEVAYTLDGTKISGADLGGQSGALEITLWIKQNPAADPFFAENYTMQASFTLGDTCKNITAEGANIVTVGSNKNISITHLPGADKSYSVKADVRDFEMGGITMTGVLTSFNIDIDTSTITNGFDELSDGLKQLIEGTEELQSGMSDLSGGIDSLQKGFIPFNDGLRGLSSGSQSINDGLSELSANGARILEGYNQLSSGMSGGTEQLDQLSTLCETIKGSNGDFLSKQLANATLQLISGIKEYGGGIQQLGDGLQSYIGGVDKLAQNYKGFNSGVRELANGASEFESGLSTLNKNVKDVPNKIGEMIDGQVAMKEGVDSAKADIENIANGFIGGSSQPTSFTSSKNAVNSVQFIMKTQDISKPKEAAPAAPLKEKQSFWQRLVALFFKG